MPPLLFLGRLCGFVQSKPGAALDDPWPTGCVKGSARTPLPLHVSLTQTHFVHMSGVWIQHLLLFYSQFQSSHQFIKHKIEEANVLPNCMDIQEITWIHADLDHRSLSSNICFNIVVNCFICFWLCLFILKWPPCGYERGANYELSIFSYHGTAAVSLSSTVLW